MGIEPLPWRDRLARATTNRFPGDPVHRWLLLALLALAAALRLWNLPHIPYTHDEISALLRLRFHSFAELISHGVAVDAHPAGVQVFEWAWTGLFGTAEAAVKLPFILMGIAALFLLYRFAAYWTSPAAALLSIAFIGTVQYTVMYAQIARPYAVGFFTCALLMDQLTRAIGGRRWAWPGATFALVLCAYTHHFALLFAGIAWLCTWPLVDRAQRRPLLAAAAVALALYLPHLPITLRQYGYKGVWEWLLPPGPSWLPEYVAWTFEFSIPLAAVVLAVALGGWLRAFRSAGGGRDPFIPLCLTLGLAPLAIGYAYSVWRAPVLQYSVLLFSFPFLVFPLFAGWRTMKPLPLAVLVALIAGTAVHGLTAIRQHYAVFYKSKYEAAVRGLLEASAQHDRLALVDVPAEIPGFYFRQWGVDSNAVRYINLRGRSPYFLDSALQASSARSAFLGISTGGRTENVAVVRSFFPFLAQRHDMVEGQSFLFTARPEGPVVNDLTAVSTLAPEAVKGEGWEVDPKLTMVRDTTMGYGMAPRQWAMGGHAFGLVFERSVYAMRSGDNDVLEAALDVVDPAPGCDVRLVMELKEGDRTIKYSSSTTPRAGGGRLFVATPLSDLPRHGQGTKARIYVWNPGLHAVRIASIEIRVRAGNPWLYGFFQPLKGPLVYR